MMCYILKVIEFFIEYRYCTSFLIYIDTNDDTYDDNDDIRFYFYEGSKIFYLCASFARGAKWEPGT